MKRILILVMLWILMSGCTPDPRKQAQAFEIQSKAEQDALNNEMDRQHAEELHDIQVQELQLEEQHREATAKEWRAGLNKMIHYGFIFGTIGVCVSLLALAYSFSRGAIGVANATARMAEMRANLIYLDATTRQFPLFQHVHGERFAMHNPNDGSVVMLDMSNPADRQKIATSGATQIAGVIAQEARQSNDPAGVAIINPPVIEVQADGVTIGRDIIRRQE